MIRSKVGQRVLGCFLLVLSVSFIIWEWRRALNEGYYHRNAVVLFPFGAVCGVGLILFPVDYDRLMAEHGVDRVRGFSHMPPAWRVLALLAVAAGLANWFAIANL